MYQTFLAIISLVACAYALFTKQSRMGLSYFIYAVAFFLLVPSLTSGIKTDIFGAIAMALFVLATALVVIKKTPKAEPKEEEETVKNE